MRPTLLFAACLFTFSVNAQSLVNTTWSVYNFENEHQFDMLFGPDMIMYFETQGGSMAVATYTENGNTMTTTDIDGICAATGTYTFAFVGNTLEFTEVDDPCDGRDVLFVSLTWISSMTMDIAEDQGSTYAIFPNPTNGAIQIDQPQPEELLIEIFDLSGHLVLARSTSSITTRLDLHALPSGTYLLRTIGDSATSTRKIVVE